ncbi:unnamed protein product [Bemisia tabaci]|uniref:RIB43A-like with coiled-coils protein 2 n=2 Tax=Bemisia tabaci TaxID=7038 RepID=A0A9P0F577_BEMTA|nr:unnamed protein product [Bemisia tabaci]
MKQELLSTAERFQTFLPHFSSNQRRSTITPAHTSTSNKIFNVGLDSDFRTPVDSEALKAQADARKKAEILDKQQDEAIQQHENYTYQLAVRLAEQAERRKRQYNQEITQYHQLHQRPESRREFDLNDPDYLRKSKPARTSDDDPTLTISSAQIFEGEDRSLTERRKRQQEQQKEWLNRQIEERKNTLDTELRSNHEYFEYLLERNRRAIQLDALEKECNKHMLQTVQHYNTILAEQRKMEEQQRERQKIENDRAEMTNTANSDLLTEPLEVGFMSAFGPGRINCPMYKGMTNAMIQKIRETQHVQREEKKKQREAEAKNERRWQDLMETQAKQAAQEMDVMRQKQRETQYRIAQENKFLSQEQEEKLNNFKKYVNVNVPTAEYFNKFGTSSR